MLGVAVDPDLLLLLLLYRYELAADAPLTAAALERAVFCRM